jgi:hypothetical protein
MTTKVAGHTARGGPLRADAEPPDRRYLPERWRRATA